MGQAVMRGKVAFQRRPSQVRRQPFGPRRNAQAFQKGTLRGVGMGRGQRGEGFEIDMRGQVGLAGMGQRVVKGV